MCSADETSKKEEFPSRLPCTTTQTQSDNSFNQPSSTTKAYQSRRRQSFFSLLFLSFHLPPSFTHTNHIFPLSSLSSSVQSLLSFGALIGVWPSRFPLSFSPAVLLLGEFYPAYPRVKYTCLFYHTPTPPDLSPTRDAVEIPLQRSTAPYPRHRRRALCIGSQPATLGWLFTRLASSTHHQLFFTGPSSMHHLITHSNRSCLTKIHDTDCLFVISLPH